MMIYTFVVGPSRILSVQHSRSFCNPYDMALIKRRDCSEIFKNYDERTQRASQIFNFVASYTHCSSRSQYLTGQSNILSVQ